MGSSAAPLLAVVLALTYPLQLTPVFQLVEGSVLPRLPLCAIACPPNRGPCCAAMLHAV